ncbi:hypothetical protein [Flavobacterium sp. J27]|uniref:hypothetical protein n=1 Tax=Flavobacterium sp. J27 TaxID=2060419 RepID=UPI00103042CA|nr:hypothetical protein [Flavobacterium sp. J27]
MKRFTLTLVFAMMFCLFGFSQSNNGTISGYFTVILGQPTTFTLSNFQESESYKWDVNTNLTNSKNKKGLGELKIIGNNNEKFLIVEPTELGIFSIEIVYTDKKGYHTASFIGNIVSPTITQQEESITALDVSKKQKQ